MSRDGSSSRRRRSKATCGTSSRSSKPTRARTQSRSHFAKRSSISDGRRVSDSDGLDRLIAAEQDERRRIALFLHDGPVQNLAGIALMLDAALHSITTAKLEDARIVLAAG